MTQLTIYKQEDESQFLFDSVDFNTIALKLHGLGMRCERWVTTANLSAMPTDEEIIEAYKSEIDAFITKEGFKSFDIASVRENTPNVTQLREKYLVEHTHTEDEVRFFVEGSGVFYINLGDTLYRLVCEKGDLVSVPANVPHWYDMGEKPNFTAIRLFNHLDGWVGYPVNKTVS